MPKQSSRKEIETRLTSILEWAHQSTLNIHHHSCQEPSLKRQFLFHDRSSVDRLQDLAHLGHHPDSVKGEVENEIASIRQSFLELRELIESMLPGDDTSLWSFRVKWCITAKSARFDLEFGGRTIAPMQPVKALCKSLAKGLADIQANPPDTARDACRFLQDPVAGRININNASKTYSEGKELSLQIMDRLRQIEEITMALSALAPEDHKSPIELCHFITHGTEAYFRLYMGDWGLSNHAALKAEALKADAQQAFSDLNDMLLAHIGFMHGYCPSFEIGLRTEAIATKEVVLKFIVRIDDLEVLGADGGLRKERLAENLALMLKCHAALDLKGTAVPYLVTIETPHDEDLTSIYAPSGPMAIARLSVLRGRNLAKEASQKGVEVYAKRNYTADEIAKMAENERLQAEHALSKTGLM